MPTRQYNILIDPPTAAVLALSSNLSAIIILEECVQDTIAVFGVQNPNYTYSLIHEEPFFLARQPSTQLPYWRWNFDARKFSRSPIEVISETLKDRSALAVAKLNTVETLLAYMNYARNGLHTGMQFQETVYQSKKSQAENFKKSDYDESLETEIPYVAQYADLAGISLKQAANDILFKAKLDEDVLLKTEMLRMTYLRKIKEATKVEEIQSILEALQRDSNRWKGVRS